MMMKYLRAYRSFARGEDGLTNSQQIDRNVTIIAGNLVIVFIALCLSVMIALARWWVTP